MAPAPYPMDRGVGGVGPRTPRNVRESAAGRLRQADLGWWRMVSNELLAAALPEVPRHKLIQRVEKHALQLTWRAWRRRQEGRLHPVPDMDLRTEQARLWADDSYGDRFVGVVPPESVLRGEEFVTHQLARVGIWGYITERSMIGGGPELVLWDFEGSSHSSLHRSIGLVGFVYVLPRPFQLIAREAHRIRHSWWDEYDECYYLEDPDNFTPLEVEAA